MNPTSDLTTDPTIRRILVMKWSAMGDVVISSAMFQDIRRAFPEAEIDLHTLPPYRQLFEHDPSFSELCTIDVRRRQGGWRGLWSWLRFVLGRHYDVVFDLQSNDRSRLAMTLWWLTGSAPRWRVGNHRRFPTTSPGRPAPFCPTPSTCSAPPWRRQESRPAPSGRSCIRAKIIAATPPS